MNSFIRTQHRSLIRLTWKLCRVDLPGLEEPHSPSQSAQTMLELRKLSKGFLYVLDLLIHELPEGSDDLFCDVPEEGSVPWVVLMSRYMHATLTEMLEHFDRHLAEAQPWDVWIELVRTQGILLHAAVFLDEEIAELSGVRSPLASIRYTLLSEAREAREQYEVFHQEITSIITLSKDKSLASVSSKIGALKDACDTLRQTSSFRLMYARDQHRFMVLYAQLQLSFYSPGSVDEMCDLLDEVSRFAGSLLSVERREIFTVEQATSLVL